MNYFRIINQHQNLLKRFKNLIFESIAHTNLNFDQSYYFGYIALIFSILQYEIYLFSNIPWLKEPKILLLTSSSELNLYINSTLNFMQVIYNPVGVLLPIYQVTIGILIYMIVLIVMWILTLYYKHWMISRIFGLFGYIHKLVVFL